ncbi:MULTISPECIES: hypothetical protein [Achromobacter]|uniref:Uncharacterized protein n=1 Tax=Achromobacter denitrificans TaxID=32002 RepID=A0A6N0JR33_ACHDE|nr:MULTISPECIES: hypothetical protein [Achromobacter]QKQ49008.1 hypothetical protein FOC81_20850 [Achromobacter denitrificans]
MPSRLNDPGIPTLTQRAEPVFHVPAPADEAEAPLLTELADDAASEYDDDGFPVLTDLADSAALPGSASVQPPEPTVPSLDAAVLGARLQAEVEQLMREALADAIEQIQARMDAELPGIVARVLRDVRPG